MGFIKNIVKYFKSCAYELGLNDADAFFRKELRKKSEIVMDGKTFFVDDECGFLYPELHTLILNTESMDHEERQYWFDSLPIMTDEQVDELFDILETERIKLGEIEAKYQEEIKKLNEKHSEEWKAFISQSSKRSEDTVVSNAMRAISNVR